MDAILNQTQVNCTKAIRSPYSVNSVNGDQTANGGLRAYHQPILDSHANSGLNALIYIGVVLLLYIIFMTIIVMRYVLMKSNSKDQPQNTPYYFGPNSKTRSGTTTTATTTLGGASVSNYGCGGQTSVNIEGDETPPEIRFIETEL